MNRQRVLLIAAVLVVVAVLDVVLVKTLHIHRKTTPGRAIAAANAIPGSDGTQLAGEVWAPGGSGKFPLVVMPAAFGKDATEYKYVGQTLANQGYVVVAYAQRGFMPSQGQVDFEGAPTQADVSSVITWALAHTPADPTKIGVMGVSYGAGATLLSAERDNRIKAVVVMSAWTDLQQSFFPNDTPNTQAIKTLYGAAKKRFSPPLTNFYDLLDSRDFAGAKALLATLSPERSAITNVDALNRNHTAVMIANDFEDSYFAPNQLVTFYDKLTGPKRLQLAIGDHGSQEVAGLLGQQSEVWTDATQWLDHYLRGMNNGIQSQQPVRLKDVATGQWHTYSSWPGSAQVATFYLDRSGGALSTKATTSWSTTIKTGTPTLATTPPIQIGVATYRPATGVPVSTLPANGAGVWTGPTLTQGASIDGTPSLHMTVTPSTANATMFSYLYDVNANGLGTLITSAPYSLTDVTPGAAQIVDVALRPISWTVPAGHHLAFVVDTFDRRFTALGAVGRPLVLSSPVGDPSRLTVPVA